MEKGVHIMSPSSDSVLHQRSPEGVSLGIQVQTILEKDIVARFAVFAEHWRHDVDVGKLPIVLGHFANPLVGVAHLLVH